MNGSFRDAFTVTLDSTNAGAVLGHGNAGVKGRLAAERCVIIGTMETRRRAHPGNPAIQPTASSGARFAAVAASLRSPVGAAFGLLVGWRCGLWLFALLAMSTYLPTPAPTTPRLFFGRTVLSGEAHWHLQLVQEAYRATDEGAVLAAFPPLYALLIRLLGLVTPSFVWAGALVSHAALLGALVYLLSLVSLDRDRPTALRAGLAALLWPGAAQLGTISPDSTLMLTCAGALYHARRGQWGWAALWAALAGLTRGSGVLIVVPLLVAWLVQRRQRADTAQRQELPAILAIAAAPLAFLIFLAFLWWQLGTPLAFFRAQHDLGFGTVHHPIGLGTVADWRAILDNAAPAVRGYNPERSAFKTSLIPAIVDAGTLLIGGLAGVWLLLRARWADGLFVLLGVIASFAIWGLPNSPQHLLALVPLYLALAVWTSRPLVGYLAAFLSLEVLALAYYLYLNIL
jgi:hypothetical protein